MRQTDTQIQGLINIITAHVSAAAKEGRKVNPMDLFEEVGPDAYRLSLTGDTFNRTWATYLANSAGV